MKALYTMVLLCTMLNAQWTFTKKELSKITPKQEVVLKKAIKVGKKANLGLKLAAIAVVETKLGKYKSTTKKHCGVTQISTRYSGIPCKVLESNPDLAIKVASDSLKYWLVRHKNMKKAITAYNSGNPIGNRNTKEYYRRVIMVEELLKKEFG